VALNAFAAPPAYRAAKSADKADALSQFAEPGNQSKGRCANPGGGRSRTDGLLRAEADVRAFRLARPARRRASLP